MIYHDTESYFRPKAICESHITIPAYVFNQIRVLILQIKGDCMFVPVRSIQYQAVLTKQEIIFIDSQGGYRLDDHGEGGRLIGLAWCWDTLMRDSLSAPVQIKLVCYQQHLETVQRQLLRDFPAAIQAKLDVLHRQETRHESYRVLSFKKK